MTLQPAPEPVTAIERHHSARVQWDDLWNLDAEANDWLLSPLIARGRGHALYAPGKAGKSLLALYLAAAAATGRAVLDHPAGQPIRTLYLDLEMTREDVRERLADMGFGPTDNLENLAYYSLPSLAVLDSQTGGQEVLELALAHNTDLVVIDTMSRVIGGEENSADTLRAFFRWTGSPLKAAGIATLRIDHAGKDIERGMRGSSAKADDVDVVWSLIPRDHGRFDLKATHRRMGWVPEIVNIAQTSDPLEYRLTDDTWPAGTAEIVAALDRLGLPLDIGRPTAAKALRNAGEKARNEAVSAALRFRRLEAERCI